MGASQESPLGGVFPLLLCNPPTRQHLQPAKGRGQSLSAAARMVPMAEGGGSYSRSGVRENVALSHP